MISTIKGPPFQPRYRKAFFKYLVSFFSLEPILVLHLILGTAGRHSLPLLPFSIGEALFFVSVIGSVFAVATNHQSRLFMLSRSSVYYLALVTLFVGWNLFSWLWTPSQNYAWEKTADFLVYVLWPTTLVVLMVSRDTSRVFRFLNWFVVFSTGVSILTVTQWIQSGSGWNDPSIFGSSYLGIARIAGYGFVVSIVGIIRIKSPITVLYLFNILLSLLALSIAGSRAPIVGGIFALGITLAMSLYSINHLRRRQLRQRLVIFLMALSMLVVCSFFFLRQFQNSNIQLRSIYRVSVLFSESGGGESARDRTIRYMSTIDLLTYDRWVGFGIGSWPVITGLGDNSDYPHNIFLEVLFEVGVVGLFIFLGLLVYGLSLLWPWVALRERDIGLMIFVLFVFTLIGGQFSGDITDNRLIFVTLGLMTLRSSIKH